MSEQNENACGNSAAGPFTATGAIRSDWSEVFPSPASFSSPAIDVFLLMGIALDQIARHLVAHPETRIEIQKGQIRIWSMDGMPLSADVLLATFGYFDLEPTVDDWQRVAAYL